MVRASGRSALLLCGWAALAAGAFAAEFRDDRGVAVGLSAPAARIVTLSPHLTELVFAAGAGDRLAGVARFSDYPATAQSLPRIGDAARVDPERILALAPDLVLAWRSGNQANDVARLEKLDLRVFVTEPERLGDIARLLRTIGGIAGTRDAAERAAREFEREIDALRARYGAAPPVRVFYEIWHRPLLTVNGRHLISDVIGLCGGVNVFSDLPSLTPAVSVEALLAARPQAIIGGSSAITPQQFAAQWRHHPVAEVRRLPVLFVHPDEIQRQTPRIVEGAKKICAALEEVRAAGASRAPGDATSAYRAGSRVRPGSRRAD